MNGQEGTDAIYCYLCQYFHPLLKGPEASQLLVTMLLSLHIWVGEVSFS